MVGAGHGLIATQTLPVRWVESVNAAHEGVDLILVGGCGGDEFGFVGFGEGGPLRHADAAEVLGLKTEAVAATKALDSCLALLGVVRHRARRSRAIPGRVLLDCFPLL